MGSGDTSPEKTYRIDLTHFGSADCLVGRGTMSTNLAPAPETLSSVVTQTEILTVSDVAKLLKFSKGQVYDLTRSRAKVRQTRPIPVLRINGNLRFRRSDIEQWLNGLAEAGRVQ